MLRGQMAAHSQLERMPLKGTQQGMRKELKGNGGREGRGDWQGMQGLIGGLEMQSISHLLFLRR